MERGKYSVTTRKRDILIRMTRSVDTYANCFRTSRKHRVIARYTIAEQRDTSQMHRETLGQNIVD